ncbi:MAG TPA: hypothetical protein VMW63_05470 [Methanoregulaceae archaeon]|nr:hypothetical protein [Methanoregulaceae archaeon]
MFFLLCIGAIVRYLLVSTENPIIPNILVAFYCLAIIVIMPDFLQALAIGVVFGLVAALISHSLFDPAFLVSEPLGAAVCLGSFMVFQNRIWGAPFLTAVAATLASGIAYTSLAVSFGQVKIINEFSGTEEFIIGICLIMAITALLNGLIVAIAYDKIVAFREHLA